MLTKSNMSVLFLLTAGGDEELARLRVVNVMASLRQLWQLAISGLQNLFLEGLPILGIAIVDRVINVRVMLDHVRDDDAAGVKVLADRRGDRSHERSSAVILPL